MKKYLKMIESKEAKKALSSLNKSFKENELKNLNPVKRNKNKSFMLHLNDICLDASRHQISEDTIKKAKNFAENVGINEWINEILNGSKTNISENQPALHAALRCDKKDSFSQETIKLVMDQKEKLFSIAEKIRHGELLSANGKKFKSIISIGIGGSDLGPRMALNALKPYSNELKIKFVSNIDPSDIINSISNLDPDTTLLIISSKSFKTVETMTNADFAYNWLSKNLGHDNAKKQRIAITSNVQLAQQKGFKENQILAFPKWVGGRTSIWSAVGLPIVLSIGKNEFQNFLNGGRFIDQHILNDSINSLPCLMALLSYIQRKYFKSGSHAVVPYDANLRLLPSYLQQLEMESNGKSVKLNGKLVEEPCVPVIWGAQGTDAQHSFFQMLHQGLEKIPIDILLARTPSYDLKNPQILNNHKILAANALAQAEAFFNGKNSKDRDRFIYGGKPVTLLTYNKLSPKTLGSIIALYEYKVLIQAGLWGINPFDQFGVELGKEMANALLSGNEKEYGIETGSLEKLLKIVPERT